MRSQFQSKFISVFVIIFVMLLYNSQALAGQSKNFDDCILETMRGVTSDFAAKAIARACRKKFPVGKAPDIDTEEIPDDELRNLNGVASKSGEYFKGNLHNGNKDWAITSITIIVYDLNGKAPNYDPKPSKSYDPVLDAILGAPPQIRSSPLTQKSPLHFTKYKIELHVKPLTSAKFSFYSSLPGRGFGWQIIHAEGYKGPVGKKWYQVF